MQFVFVFAGCSFTFVYSQTELCVAPGPGKDMFDSTRIIGERQYNAGKVSYRVSYRNFGWEGNYWPEISEIFEGPWKF